MLPGRQSKNGNRVMILSMQLDGERGQVNSKRAKNLRTIRTLIPITSLVLPFALAFAQAPAARPEFEVASVRRNHSGSRPWLVPPVGGRFWGNQRHAGAADWRRLAAKSLRQPVMGCY